MRILSLGAGVQSTALLLMALRGEFGDMPDCAIFADTQAEPASVYRHLDWLEVEVAPFPIHRVTAGSLEESIKGGVPEAWIPGFVLSGGSPSLLRRQCTKNFKLVPIRRKCRELVGSSRSATVEQWIGISFDEWRRMKESRDRWITNRWPLVEKRMTRRDCAAWLKAHGYPEPPKSACSFCPYHDNALWREMKTHDPASWAVAVEMDEAIRHLPRIDGEVFLHRSLKPLSEVDFRNAEDHGQQSLWGNECEGMCGV